MNSVLSGFMDCEPIVAAWSLLSYPEVPTNAPIDPNAIVQGFLSFPQHLRKHLGPGLGKRLRLAGYPKQADHVVRSLLRNEETTTPAAGFLGSQSMSTDRSEETLNAVIAGNSEPSAESLIQLIDTRIKQGDTVTLEMAELVGSYAVEYREQPLGNDLNRAYISALGAAGAFGQAFKEIANLANHDADFQTAMQSELMSLLAKRAADPAFLKFATRPGKLNKTSLKEQVANDIAQRLLSLGFPQVAATYVPPLASGPAETERKLMRARIALMTDRPHQAMLQLIGINLPDAIDLRAQAKSMAGEHDIAEILFSQSGMAQEAMRQAWLDENWPSLRKHEDPSIAALAQKLSSPTLVDEGFSEDQVLARNAAMIEDSQSMRALIRALLDSTPRP